MKRLIGFLLLFTGLLAQAQFDQRSVEGQDVYPQSESGGTVAINVVVNGTTVLTPSTDYTYEITLPTAQVTLDANATTTLGTMNGTGMWNQITLKPSSTNLYYKFTDEDETSSTYPKDWTISSLQHGYYVFRYYEKRSDGKTFYQDVKIIVNSSGAAAQVNAGNDTTVWKWQEPSMTMNGQTVVMPEQYFRLDGSASKGAASYQWTQVSGPATLTIDNANQAVAEVHNLQLGIYEFQLTINGTLSETRTFRFEDMNTKWGAPCRTGAPHTFEILPSTGPTLDAATGRTYAAWQRINIKQYIKSTYGEDLMGGDILTFNGQGIDSVLTMEIGGFGGSEGCRVQLRTKTSDPIRMKGFNGYLHFNKAFGAADSIAAVYFDLDGTYWRTSGTPYGFLVDNYAWANRDYQTAIIAPRTRANFWNGSPVGMIGTFVSDFSIKGVQGRGVAFVQFKHTGFPANASQLNKFVLKNINFEQNWWGYTYVEGMYAGDTDPDGNKAYNNYIVPPRLKNMVVRENYFESTGWDAIQVANATSGVLIENNLVRHAAMRNWASQQAGIMFGGNNNGIVRGNVIQGVGGNGIEGFGHSTNSYVNNVIDSTMSDGGTTGYGMYLKSQVTFPEMYPYQTPIIDGNVFTNWGASPAIKVANSGGAMGAPTISNNIFGTSGTAASAIESAFSYTSTGNLVKPLFNWRITSVEEKTNDAATSMQITATINGGAPQTFTSVAALNTALRSAAGGNIAPLIATDGTRNVGISTAQVTLDASVSDPDGSVVTKSWTEVSGGAATIGTINGYQVTITGLEVGAYVFRLSVTDDQGAVSTADVAVNVLPYDVTDNNPPNVTLTPSQTVVSTQATLSGTASDPDNDELSFMWSQVSGPSIAVIQSPSQITTQVTNLTTGTYVFRLSVQDDAGGETTADQQVVVNLTGELPYQRVYRPFINVRKFAAGTPVIMQAQPPTQTIQKTTVKKAATTKKATTKSSGTKPKH